MLDTPTLPVTYRAPVARAVFLLLVSSFFVAVGIFSPDSKLAQYYLVGFFGLGMIVAISQLLRGSAYLTLTADGMIVVSLYRKWFLPWEAVQSFTPVRLQLTKYVGWILAPNHANASLPRLGRALSGVDGMLPSTYGLAADDLAAILNKLRAAYAKPAL